MLTLLRPSFPHRRNKDGSFDSICTVCFATVASVEDEWELASYESKHNCDLTRLYQLSQESFQPHALRDRIGLSFER